MVETILHYIEVLLATVFVLGLIIVVHEFGHLLAAKASGMIVREFSVGFGPRLLGWNWGETKISLRPILIGGYVRIAGLEPGEWAHPLGFYSKPPIQRGFVLAAGGVLNLLCAYWLFFSLAVTKGVAREVTRKVDLVEWGSPAHGAGIRKGDEILGVGGRVTKIEEVVRVIERSAGKEVEVLVRRGGKVLRLPVVPKLSWKQSLEKGRLVARRVGVIGAHFAYEWKKARPKEAFYVAARKVAAVFLALRFLGYGIRRLFRPENPLGGPIAIAKEVGIQAQAGWWRLLLLAAGLSVVVGFINLFPFPALDGGRLVFVALEAMKLRVHPRTEARFHLAGFMALLFFILLVTAQDIWRLGQ